ncbi:MAG: hypothetical protein ABMB14_41180 [Myxococcota bacterium]
MSNERVDVGAWLVPGARWFVRTADFDAEDDYEIVIRAVDPFAIAWGFAGKGERPWTEEGAATFGPDAPVDGDGVVFLSQGTAMARDDDDGLSGPFARHTPPFLVSRRTLASLHAGTPARFTIYGEDVELERVGSGVIPVPVNDGVHPVQVVHAAGGDVSVWIVDHPTFPVLLRAEFQGDNQVLVERIVTP